MAVVQTHVNGTHRGGSIFHAPIAADLAEAERIFTGKLVDSRRHVAQLIGRVDSYRGKRLRPTIVLLTARACGELTSAHHILAAVVEMIHTATLVHDDVLDAAELRRHVRTVNAEWGNHASILLGDMLFSQAFHLASTVDARACELIGAATNRVCEGELHQVMERGNLELSEQDYLDIVEGKTAELTACCSRIGAIYAGAHESFVEQLAEYGRCLGIAFQIADDMLDMIGMDATTGKTLGTDLAQQKLTLPLIYALDRLPPSQAARLRDLLREPSTPHVEVAEYLRQTGAMGYARRRAEEFAERARNALNELPRTEYRNLLATLTDWTVRREK